MTIRVSSPDFPDLVLHLVDVSLEGVSELAKKAMTEGGVWVGVQDGRHVLLNMGQVRSVSLSESDEDFGESRQRVTVDAAQFGDAAS